MELVFTEPPQKVADGGAGIAFHSPDNVIQFIYKSPEGNLRGIEADTPMGDFENLDFFQDHLVSTDANVEHLKAVYLPRMNFFLTWKSGNRHRKGVFILKQEVNKYLENGSVVFNGDSPVKSLSISLQNPDGIISAEREIDSETFPGSRINLFFRIGNSTRFPLGVYYIDKISTNTGDPIVRIDARSGAGKLLKDQTFDENHEYGPTVLHAIFKDIIEQAGIISVDVTNTGETAGIKYPPNMTLYEGLEELLMLTDDWIIKENITGRMSVGPLGAPIHGSAGVYNFERGKDCFSRAIDRDDFETYSRVCVHNRDFSIAEYRDINFRRRWNLPRNKTLFVQAPEGATSSQISRHANNLRSRMGSVGIVETFVGPIRPHVEPGDQAQMGSENLGLITQVEHRFGIDGFSTTFIVDSGGSLKKQSIKDLIDKMTKTQSGQVELFE